ncbi:hypothetical protein [Mycobacteroides abscessus]|nr:hypothetical protein [Mycobacteroides abscessus]SHQ45986.1 Uncharacterised protein [Mycobacteroides abscessus subsp. abscessus]SKQ87240.1 Uncharacterised protein [Mycobacteroides abscessus subsp. massiliense]SLC52103.1 Uncharacterised protein [Mycobacteroides abscessus subsp. massiliense]
MTTMAEVPSQWSFSDEAPPGSERYGQLALSLVPQQSVTVAEIGQLVAPAAVTRCIYQEHADEHSAVHCPICTRYGSPEALKAAVRTTKRKFDEAEYPQWSLNPHTNGSAHRPRAALTVATSTFAHDGISHPDEEEHLRRINVAYAVVGQIAAAEKKMRRIYQDQTGKRLTTLPHRHPDIAGSAMHCAICATYGTSNILLAKILTSKLESIERIHPEHNGTLYRRWHAETYLATGQEAIDTVDLYEMFGDFWWDTLSFAIGVSTMHPRELGELALLLPAAPSPFSGGPAPIAIKWLTDAALAPLRQLVSHQRSWAPIHSRIVAEINQRSRGSRQGAPAESLELEFWRMKTAVVPARRKLVAL